MDIEDYCSLMLLNAKKMCNPFGVQLRPCRQRPWSSFSPKGELVECGDSSLHGSESGDKSPHSTFGGLNDDQGRNGLGSAHRREIIEKTLQRVVCFEITHMSWLMVELCGQFMD